MISPLAYIHEGASLGEPYFSSEGTGVLMAADGLKGGQMGCGFLHEYVRKGAKELLQGLGNDYESAHGPS